jgi:glycosyltransferase involved in cell wall biosynthesis
VDVYLRGLVEHLGRLDHESRYTLFVNREDRGTWTELPSNFRRLAFCVRARGVRLAFQQVLLPAAARVLGADVVHSPAFLMPLYRGRSRHLLSVHDMTFFSHRRHHSPLHRSAAFRQAVAASIRRADLRIVPSRATRDDLVACMPAVARQKIRVVPYGIGPEFRPHTAAEVAPVLRRLGIPIPYVLHLGTIEPRKNLGRLVESYRRLVVDGAAEHLVLAGRLGWDQGALLAELERPELRGRVHLTGHLPVHDVPPVHAGAALFVSPSLGEGFGFPPLEAMACGVPVVASRAAALAENLGDAAMLVDPTDTEAFAEAMRSALRDRDRRVALAERGLERARAFPWEATARGTLACYHELASEVRVGSGRDPR